MPSAGKTALKILVAGTAGATLLVSAGVLAGAERWIVLAHIQYWPYIVFLAAGVAALAGSFALPRAWRFAAAITLLVMATFLMDLSLGLGESGAGRVRVMTYNAKDYETFDRPGGSLQIAAEIAEHDPDVVVMQDAWDVGSSPEDVKRAIFGKRQVFVHQEYVVASRFPLSGCAALDMSFGRHVRTYVHCVMTAHGTEVDLYTAHFESPRRGLTAARRQRWLGADAWRENIEARLAEARAVSSRLRDAKRPVILAGDLNAPERSLVMRPLLRAGLRDAFSVAGLGYGYTYGHLLPPHISFLRIDHILVSPQIAVLECTVGRRGVSPHRSVIADLALQRRP